MWTLITNHVSWHQDCDRGTIMGLSIDGKEGQSSYRAVDENSEGPEL